MIPEGFLNAYFSDWFSSDAGTNYVVDVALDLLDWNLYIVSNSGEIGGHDLLICCYAPPAAAAASTCCCCFYYSYY